MQTLSFTAPRLAAARDAAAADVGTLFEIGTSGKGYRVLYRFKGGSNDGASPYFGLVDVQGTFYGTTSGGGGSGCGGGGCGTVFKMSASGVDLKALYSFTVGSDDASPDGLVNVSGTLYDTTYRGGGSGCGGSGCGTSSA